MTGPKKRSVTLAGHRTSLSMEEEFWDALKDIAGSEGKSVNRILSEIDAQRGKRNLSSTLRVYILERMRRRQPARSVFL